MRQGDLGGEKIAMRIDANSIDFLMKILSDLYSDPQEAVIREYSVNARDSHIEAGITRPIEITTPTRLAPYFKVQDFGVGLGLNDLRDIYSAYGASTKRQTNEQAGMLGLGSKSGLTISSQFTVIAVKNGLKAHVSVSRTETGGAVMEIVDTAATTESNGVTISIPVGHNSVGFEEKVKNFFKYWPKGSVLVNGREPEHLVAEELAPGIRLVDNPAKSGYGFSSYDDKPDVIVMGGIAYPIDSDYTPGFRTAFHLIFDVPIGTVNFTPSREQLHYTKQTKDTIADCYKRYDEAMSGRVSADLLAATSVKDALTTANKWMERLGHRSIPAGWRYKGKDIPEKLPGYSVLTLSGYNTFSVVSFSLKNLYGIKSRGDYYTQAPHTIVTDFPLPELSSYAKGRINKFRELYPVSSNVIITTDNMIANDFWTADLKKYTWKELLAATRQPKASTANLFKKDDEFHVLQEKPSGYFDWEVKAVPAGKRVYYLEPKDFPKVSAEALGRLAKELDAVVVKVYARRLEAFNKLHSSANILRSMKTDLQTLYDSKVSEADKFHNASYSRGIDIGWLPVDRIDDKELVRLIKLAKTPRDSKRWFNQIVRDMGEIEIGHLKDEGTKLDLSSLDKYPLLGSFSSGRAKQNTLYMDDVCDYLNNTYKIRK